MNAPPCVKLNENAMLSLASLAASFAAPSAGDACISAPYAAYALDSSLNEPYVYKLLANNSYVNTLLNGTVLQTGTVLSMTADADGACLITASAVAAGYPPLSLAVCVLHLPLEPCL